MYKKMESLMIVIKRNSFLVTVLDNLTTSAYNEVILGYLIPLYFGRTGSKTRNSC